MKVLHTSDWHIGKKLGRFDRTAEYRQVLEEVAEIADREKADLVVNSGDVFDRSIPSMEDLGLGLEALIRLTNGGCRPVVAIAGNHDSPKLFEVLAPHLAPSNVHMVGKIKPPEGGGVLDLETPGGRAVVSCFPFLREGLTFDAWEPSGKSSRYSERLKAISRVYSTHAAQVAKADAVTILAAHFLVGGAKVHGHGAPRGERPLHMGEAYAAASLPDDEAGPQYVAMGHIHAPQPVPYTPFAAEYAGSLLEMDFGEAGEQKRVVIVDIKPGLPAQVTSVDLQGGRRLLRPSGTWAEIMETPGVYDSYLDLTVKTDGPDPSLADRARDEFEFLVKVRADYPRTGNGPPTPGPGRPLASQYGDYYQHQTGAAAPEGLMSAFRKLEEEATRATS